MAVMQLAPRSTRLLELAVEGLDSDEWPTVEAIGRCAAKRPKPTESSVMPIA